MKTVTGLFFALLLSFSLNAKCDDVQIDMAERFNEIAFRALAQNDAIGAFVYANLARQNALAAMSSAGDSGQYGRASSAFGNATVIVGYSSAILPKNPGTPKMLSE